MDKLLQKIRRGWDKPSKEDLDRHVQFSTLGTAIITLLSFVFSISWTLYSNYCQDKQWAVTYESQKAQISELSEQNDILQNALEELSSQNESFRITNEVLNSSLEELKHQNEINEKNLDLLISEKGIQVRIGYVNCAWYSLWCLLNELKDNTLLIVNNELTEALSLEYLSNLELAEQGEIYSELDRIYDNFCPDFDSTEKPQIVFLQIDLAANIKALANDLTLQTHDVIFPETVPVALPKLSMYAMPNAKDHRDLPHDMTQYHGKVENETYRFSDQFVDGNGHTTILCPVMVQSTLPDTLEEDHINSLTQCNATYPFVCIPQSITFTDPYLKETIRRVIRDLNDSAAITEYTTVIGYG